MQPQRTRWQPPVRGLVAVTVALGVAELATGVLGARSLLAVVADRVIVTTPGPIVRFAIENFGTANRTVLLTSILVVVAVVAVTLPRLRARWAGADAAAFFGFAAVVGLAAVADPNISANIGVAAAVLAGAAGLAAFRTLERRETVATPGAAAAGSAGGMQVDGPLESPTDPPKPSRREFLTWAGGLTGGAVAAATAGTVLRNRIGAAAAPAPSATPSTPPATTNGGFAIDGLSPLITPNDEFYRIDTAFVPPRVDADSHVVRISGMVDQPFEISYAELLDRADVEADVHLACVSNEIGGDLVGNARWTGVPLTELLDEAGVQAPVNQVVGRAVDGWTGGFPLDVVYDGRPALVAVLMNGEPLPVAHGFPVRLVISGLYGYVSDTKWLEEIELTTFDAYDAYWITRGWAREGPVKTHSRIDVPRGGTQLTAGARVIAGVAWAGERGVDGVEVSIDGEPWRAATRGEELARTSWRQWRIDWNAEPGTHILRVRATDGDGEVQTSETARPFPDGASGYHTVTVTVA